MTPSRFRAVKVKTATLRVPMRKPTTNGVVMTGRTATYVTGQVADICQLPPVKAAAVILLAILETVEHVHRNKHECMHLAKRAANILFDVRDHMKGRWHAAPPSLLKNLRKLESTLVIIHEFMKREASGNWRSRLMRKGQIEDSLGDFNVLLDDAARTFQISALIDIQYTLHKAVTARTTLSNVSGSGTSRIEVLNDPHPIDTTIAARIHSDGAVVASPIEDWDGDDDATLGDDASDSEYGRKFIYQAASSDDEEDVRSQPIEKDFDDLGFARYHQDDIRPRGRTSALNDGWWAGTSEVIVDGEVALMKHYSGPNAQKNWMRDVKSLQNLYHPNLPQLIGLSDNTTPIPFVLLTNVESRTPEALILDALHNKSLAFCAELVLRLYRDVSEAMLYTQTENSLTDSELQDFIESASYRLDSEHSAIVGLPPPREGKWTTFRSYTLTGSLLGVALKMLPNNGQPMHLHRVDRDLAAITSGTAKTRANPKRITSITKNSGLMPLALQRKLSHLAVFVRGLLPPEDGPPVLSPEVARLISDEHYDGSRSTLPLPTLRTAVLSGGNLGPGQAYSWNENQAVPPWKFRVGDLGIVDRKKRPEGGDGDEQPSVLDEQENVGDRGGDASEDEEAEKVYIGKQFVKLCNVLDDGTVHFDIASDAWCQQWDWQNLATSREDVQGLPMGPDVHGWPMSVNPGQQIDCNVSHTRKVKPLAQAWQFLLAHGKSLGERFGVPPDELVLITSAGTNQSFSVKNGFGDPFAKMHNQRPGFGAPQHGNAFGRPGFGGQPIRGHMGGFGGFQQQAMPKIFYLFTSLEEVFRPYWAQQLVLVPPGGQPPPMDRDVMPRVSYNHGHVGYIMGYNEDFM